MHRFRALAAGTLLLSLGAATAATGPPPPRDLVGTFDAANHTATTSWRAPSDNGTWKYQVYRDNTLIASTTATSVLDKTMPGDEGFLYFVTAFDGAAWSEPAVVAVPTLSCEVVTVQTSWEYPYARARLHEECLGGITYDKQVTWKSPQEETA